MARRVTEDLDRLAELPLNEQETRHRLVASAAFQEYWSIVGAEQALLQRGDRGGALRIIDTMSGARADEVRESLGGLMAATRTRILAAQAEATRLETRTWSTVMLALGGAVGLALLGTAFITRRMTRSLRFALRSHRRGRRRSLPGAHLRSRAATRSVPSRRRSIEWRASSVRRKRRSSSSSRSSPTSFARR